MKKKIRTPPVNMLRMGIVSNDCHDEVLVSQRNPLDIVYDTIVTAGGEGAAGAALQLVAPQLGGLGGRVDAGRL